jgi:hypothetical protein
MFLDAARDSKAGNLALVDKKVLWEREELELQKHVTFEEFAIAIGVSKKEIADRKGKVPLFEAGHAST